MDSLLFVPVAATFDSSTALSAGAGANTMSNRVGLVARSTVTPMALYYDLGASPPSVDCAALLWTNLAATNTVSIEGANSIADLNAGTGTYVLLSAATAYSSASRVTSAGTKTWATFAPTVRRYWRFVIYGTLPAVGYFEVSRAMFGQRLNFAVDYSSLEMFDDDRGDVAQAEYGEDVETVRRISFGWRVRWKFGSKAEFLAGQQRLVMLGKTKPIFFLPMPSETNSQDLAAFGKMRNPAKVQSSAYDIWELGFDVVSDAA